MKTITLLTLLVISNLVTLVIYHIDTQHTLTKELGSHETAATVSDWGFYTNERHFDSQIQAGNNHKETFSKLWESFPSTINVYPSEGYYYFNGFIGNDFVRGNLGFFHDAIEKKEVSFCYDLIHADKSVDENIITLSETDGLKIDLVSQRILKCEYKGKTITVNLRSEEKEAFPTFPKREDFLGVSTDESGFRFGLFYDNDSDHFLWVLSPNTQKSLKFNNVADHLIVEPNSRFVFINDAKNNRYILAGVHEESVFGNSWYDGPFDQLPDHEIQKGNLDLKPYIKKAYPNSPEVTKYAIYESDSEMRCAISPYMQYTFPEQVVNYAKNTYPEVFKHNDRNH